MTFAVNLRDDQAALDIASRDSSSAALDQLMPLLYPELRRLAKRHLLGQPPGHTLRTTDLIHEAYLKLVRGEQTEWKDRLRFLAVASRTMRSVEKRSRMRLAPAAPSWPWR